MPHDLPAATGAAPPPAALLRTGTPDSMRALAITYNEEQYRTWGDLLYSVRTGAPAFEHAFGTGVFDYFARNPEPARVFNDAMTAWTGQVARAVADAYDFSPFATVVDVGGSHGTLLAAVLRSSPATRGILFDLPHVVDGARRPSRRPESRTAARASAATSSSRCRRAGTRTCSRRSCTTGTTSAAAPSSPSAAA
jgi:hypothetical protein